jgi:hypothetical protein
MHGVVVNWYRHQPGLTRQARSAFSNPCLRPGRQRVRPGPAPGVGHAEEPRSMSGHRPAACLLRLALAGAAPVLYAAWARPRLLTWGATPEEATGAYPGDELIPDPAHSSTMATTLPAPPERVWPWLVQMGYDRAGWYSWDTLDHGGKPSADHIVPQWQNLHEGQRVNSMANGRDWMTVAVLEANRTLVLRSIYQLPSFRTVDPRPGPLPRARMDAIWGFHLRPAPGGRTRLVIRKRGCGPRALTWPVSLLWDPLHFIMQTRQFHNLRTRADGPSRLEGELR